MLDIRLYMAQRLSALIMVPLVIGYCGHDLCSSGRVDGCRNSGAYTRLCCMVFILRKFCVAASVHGAIGVRVISFEWLGIKAYTLTLFSWSVFMALLVLGGKAVYSVTFAGAGI